MQILYEDNHIIVAVKPPNVPAQADDSGDADMLTLIKGYITEKYEKPGAVYLGLVHRLDRPVGGVMVFARTSKAAERLSAQFRGHGAKKRYAAVTQGLAEYRRELTDMLLRDEATGNTKVVKSGTAGAKEARLAYTRQAVKNGLDLVDVELYTGRHHQIRVQLKNAGLPIWGDQRYISLAVPGQQIALWAYSLSLEHPTRKETMKFTSLPEGGVWADFCEELSLMGAGVSTAYLDGDMLVADKGANIETAVEDGGEDTLEFRARKALGEAYAVHRLDRNTTGLVMMARNAKVKAELEQAVKERTVKKYYLCVVRGVPEKEEGRLLHYGVKDEKRAYLSVYDKPVKGAKELVLEYRVMRREEDRSLLRVELITGRTHQIRAQLAHIGHPLLGDDKYGDHEFNRLYRRQIPALCAVELLFTAGRYKDMRIAIPANGLDTEKLR